MTTPHSIAEFTDPEVSPTNKRRLTVSYANRYPEYTRLPAITLKGQWLGRRVYHRYAGRCKGDERLYRAHGTAAATRRKRVDAVAAPGEQAIGV